LKHRQDSAWLSLDSSKAAVTQRDRSCLEQRQQRQGRRGQQRGRHAPAALTQGLLALSGHHVTICNPAHVRQLYLMNFIRLQDKKMSSLWVRESAFGSSWGHPHAPQNGPTCLEIPTWLAAKAS
jgi:hypothetical protein